MYVCYVSGQITVVPFFQSVGMTVSAPVNWQILPKEIIFVSVKRPRILMFYLVFLLCHEAHYTVYADNVHNYMTGLFINSSRYIHSCLHPLERFLMV